MRFVLGIIGVWINWVKVYLWDFLGLSAGLFRVIRNMRILRFNVIRAFTVIGFVCVAEARMVIITLNEYAKEHEAPSECQGRWFVCNLSAHFAGPYCTYVGRPRWSHSLRPGTRRRQGCPRHHKRK